MNHAKIWSAPKWDGAAFQKDDNPEFIYRTIEPDPIWAREPEVGRLAADISDDDKTKRSGRGATMNDDSQNAGNELKARVCRVIEVSITGGERVSDITAYVKDADSEIFGLYSKDKKRLDALYNAWKDWSRVIIVARARIEFPRGPRYLYDVEKIERYEEAKQ